GHGNHRELSGVRSGDHDDLATALLGHHDLYEELASEEGKHLFSSD
ncbi:hypothetical protein AVEN_207905-1, partial [Araneus ventricosus]